jgi:hypothetical protein
MFAFPDFGFFFTVFEQQGAVMACLRQIILVLAGKSCS